MKNEIINQKYITGNTQKQVSSRLCSILNFCTILVPNRLFF